jgi:hypothetical protein
LVAVPVEHEPWRLSLPRSSSSAALESLGPEPLAANPLVHWSPGMDARFGRRNSPHRADGTTRLVGVRRVGTTLAVRPWQQGRLAPPWWLHVGVLLVGCGTINVVESAINHHLLTLPHVRGDIADSTAWDVGFLCFGARLVVAGALLVRSSSKAGDPPVDTARPSSVD